MEVPIHLYAVLMLQILPGAVTHLCLVTPLQRGDTDITHSGSDTCFRHGAPCGGEKAASSPYETYTGGEQVFIKWLQNFNHYEIGYPGYMDIAVAPYNSDNWQVLAFVGDTYTYNQDHQQNYTAFVVFPDTPCEHCVLRARYESHKPGEQTFYQCADITIKASTYKKKSRIQVPDPSLLSHKEYRQTIKKISMLGNNIQDSTNFNVSLRGFMYTLFDKDAMFAVNVTLDGKIQPYGKFDLEVDLDMDTEKRLKEMVQLRKQRYQNIKTQDSVPFILDSLVTVNNLNNLVTMYHQDGTIDDPATILAEFDTHQGTLQTSKIADFDGTPINALLSNQDFTYYTFSIEKAGSEGYKFVVGQLYLEQFTLPYHYKKLITSKPEPLYVNFQWAELDIQNKRMFVLMGNENAPDRLSARLYTFDLKSNTASKVVNLNVEIGAFMNLHYYRKTGKLYTVSPGIFYTLRYPFWSLLEIDPSTGNVTMKFKVAEWGMFRGYYGGAVFHGLDQDTGILYHVMTMQDTNAEVIAAIDIDNQKTSFSQMTSLKHIHNLALTSNSFYNTQKRT